MKYLVLFLAFSVTSVYFGQSFFVKPHTIDSHYSTSDDSNYVVLNTSAATNHKLLVFLPGTGALTKHYKLFPTLAASLGYHCVSLAYPNGSPTVASICAGNSDADCYRDIRQEVCYGTDASPNVSVDPLNSIYTRLVKLLQYLDATYPAQGWGQFLNSGNPVWSSIAVSGHSQGGGHALYLAKHESCERMMMFAGADDYSVYYSQPANWTSETGLTRVNRFFSFLHFNDDVWDYSKQYSVVQSTGMTAGGDDSTIVDNVAAPYSHSHCLYTKVPPLYPNIYSAEHNGMVVDYYTPTAGGQPIYLPVWTYMLTADITNGLAEQDASHLAVFPNPANNKLTVTIPSGYSQSIVQLYTETGVLISTTSLTGTIVADVDIAALSAGIYFVHFSAAGEIPIVQKVMITK